MELRNGTCIPAAAGVAAVAVAGMTNACPKGLEEMVEMMSLLPLTTTRWSAHETLGQEEEPMVTNKGWKPQIEGVVVERLGAGFLAGSGLSGIDLLNQAFLPALGAAVAGCGCL